MNISNSKLKIALARKEMNVPDLARVSGVSSNTINSWIKNTGKRYPSTKILGKICKALEVDVTELIED